MIESSVTKFVLFCLITSKNKSILRTQTVVKAAHYPHIAWIPDLESQHGDPDHHKIVSCIIADLELS